MADYISGYTGAQIDKSVASGSSTTGHISSSATGTGSFATIHTDSYIGVGTSVTPKTLTVAGDISASGDIYSNKIFLPALEAKGFIFGEAGTNGKVTDDGSNVIINYADSDVFQVNDSRIQFDVPLDITDSTDATDASGDTGALKTEGGASIAKKVYVGTQLSVGSHITASGNITADGDISASGDLYLSGNDIYESGSNPAKRITLGAETIFHGDISASGDLYLSGNDIYESGSNPAKRITLGAETIFHGDISASGDIFATDVIIGPPRTTKATNMELTVAGDISASGTFTAHNSGSFGGNTGGDTGAGQRGNIIFTLGIPTTPYWAIGLNGLASMTWDYLDDATGTVDQYMMLQKDGKLYVGDGIPGATVPEALTVVGNISASGDLYLSGNDIYESGSNPAKRITLGAKTIFHGDISASGDLYIGDDIFIGNRLEHTGDDDTYIDFTADTINIEAGGCKHDLHGRR